LVLHIDAWVNAALHHLFHGIVQHSLYHGGQTALLRKSYDWSAAH
jgi:hypothetical protein